MNSLEFPGGRESLQINPGNLLDSLTHVATALPPGKSFWKFEQNMLQPSTHRIGDDALGINVLPDENGKRVVIAVANAIDNLSGDQRSLTIRLNPQNHIDSLDFYNPKPHLTVTLLPHKNSFTSEARILLPLIENIASFELHYTGDKRTLHFQSLNNYSPEQLKLLFHDGKIPTIQIQTLLASIFRNDANSFLKFPLPQLNCSKTHKSIENSIATYLIQSTDSLPPVHAGETISGLVLTRDDTHQPFQITVRIETVEEQQKILSDRRPHIKTVITGETTINDGKHTISNTYPIWIPYTLQNIQAKPQLLPQEAYRLYKQRKRNEKHDFSTN